MSDQGLGKKLVEESQLQPFLDEYRAITGIELDCVGRGERPDFVFRRRAERVGIELVQIVLDPSERFNRDDRMDESDAAFRVLVAVHKKEVKRLSGGWLYPERTILIVQLMDAAAADVHPYLDAECMEEMSATGFFEIWVADYTIMEAFRTVQLIGVKPRRWRGLHSHRFSDKKSYG